MLKLRLYFTNTVFFLFGWIAVEITVAEIIGLISVLSIINYFSNNIGTTFQILGTIVFYGLLQLLKKKFNIQ